MELARDEPGPDELPGPLEITSSHDDAGSYALTIAGEIDLSTVDSLQQNVDAVLAASPTAVTFELSRVRFMDSSGLAILLTVTGAVDDVRVLDPSPTVRRVIELSGLESILRMTP